MVSFGVALDLCFFVRNSISYAVRCFLEHSSVEYLRSFWFSRRLDKPLIVFYSSSWSFVKKNFILLLTNHLPGLSIKIIMKACTYAAALAALVGNA